MRNQKITFKQGCFFAVLLYCIAVFVFWLCAKDQLNYRIDKTDMLKLESWIGEIMPDTVFTQNFRINENGELIYISFPNAPINALPMLSE